MTARTDFVSTFDFIHLRCPVTLCENCNHDITCSVFMVQFRNENFIDTMVYSEGEC